MNSSGLAIHEEEIVILDSQDPLEDQRAATVRILNGHPFYYFSVKNDAQINLAALVFS